MESRLSSQISYDYFLLTPKSYRRFHENPHQFNVVDWVRYDDDLYRVEVVTIACTPDNP